MAKVIDDTREGELSQQVEALVIKLSASEKRADEAIAVEREECAKTAERLGRQTGLVRAAPRIAAAIRSRGQL